MHTVITLRFTRSALILMSMRYSSLWNSISTNDSTNDNVREPNSRWVCLLRFIMSAISPMLTQLRK